MSEIMYGAQDYLTLRALVLKSAYYKVEARCYSSAFTFITTFFLQVTAPHRVDLQMFHLMETGCPLF
jgi:hypothetical protein